MATAVQVRRLPGWQELMLVGLFLWAAIALRGTLGLGPARIPLALEGLMIGLFSLLTGDPRFVVPINFTTTSIMVLLFPLFFVLLQYIEEDHTLSNLDAAAMTGIYLLLIYVLVFTGTGS